MALRLDFHPRAARRPPRASWTALAFALTLAAVAAVRVARQSDDLAALQARHDLLAARLAPPPAREPVMTPAMRHRLVAANQVIDELAVPWDALFAAIESADAHGLGMMSLVPNARDHSVRMTGEARSVPELLAYVDRVAALRVLDGVHLERYDTVSRDGSDIVAFTLAATWQFR